VTTVSSLGIDFLSAILTLAQQPEMAGSGARATKRPPSSRSRFLLIGIDLLAGCVFPRRSKT
jgi:hypothetical protein